MFFNSKKMSSFKLKLLLIGVETPNKINLFQKIIKNRFQTNYKRSIGVNIFTKDVEFKLGEIATLSIWDIGDQQRFKSIRSTFYKGSAGVLLIFDLTQETSYIKLRKWFTEVKKFVGNTPFVLIGNNVHIYTLKDKAHIRKTAQEFARKQGGIFIETDPNSFDVVEDVIRDFTRRIIEFKS